MDTLEDHIADLQAAAIVNATMIEALMLSHPHPVALRDTWDRLIAPRMAAGMPKAAVGQGHLTQAAIVERAAMWTSKLERLAPRS